MAIPGRVWPDCNPGTSHPPPRHQPAGLYYLHLSEASLQVTRNPSRPPKKPHLPPLSGLTRLSAAQIMQLRKKPRLEGSDPLCRRRVAGQFILWLWRAAFRCPQHIHSLSLAPVAGLCTRCITAHKSKQSTLSPRWPGTGYSVRPDERPLKLGWWRNHPEPLSMS